MGDAHALNVPRSDLQGRGSNERRSIAGATAKPIDRRGDGDIEKSEVDAVSHRNRSAERSWVAAFAAYLLAIQAVFAGFAAGAHANALSLDRTLALTRCAPGEDVQPDSDHGKSQSDVGGSCCTAGCPMHVGADPVQSEFQLLVQRPTDQAAFVRRLDRRVGSPSCHSPGNPRAPPSLA
ncbi:hypothetical protein [Bosea vestrisii]|uniref:DUF2946 domain-containing protein n=1 Tax=Bosea vestrisii TaxID=151416 RepID=A0ABW0HAE4_9HYPH